MKALKLIALISIFVTLAACNQVAEINAVSYNDSIINEQSKIIKYMINMSKNFESNLDEADLQRKEGLKQTETSIQTLEKLGDYQGDSTLRSSADNLFKFYKESFDTDFKELISILKKENIDSLDLVRMNEINNDIVKKESITDSIFQAAQTEFAKKNKFPIGGNELQKEIDKIGDDESSN